MLHTAPVDQLDKDLEKFKKLREEAWEGNDPWVLGEGVSKQPDSQAIKEQQKYLFENLKGQKEFIQEHFPTQLQIAMDFLKVSIPAVQLLSRVATGIGSFTDDNTLDNLMQELEMLGSAIGTSLDDLTQREEAFRESVNSIMDSMNKMTNNIIEVQYDIKGFIGTLPESAQLAIKEIGDNARETIQETRLELQEAKASFFIWFRGLPTYTKAFLSLGAVTSGLGIISFIANIFT